MAEIRETLMVGDHHYQVRLRGGEWYELWCDGGIVGERTEWPIDPETQEPYLGSKLLQVTTDMCIAAEHLPWKVREREGEVQ
jgi:hypothetical protein